MHPTGNDDASSGVGGPFPPDLKQYALVSLGIILNFIESWIQSLKKNYLHQTTMKILF